MSYTLSVYTDNTFKEMFLPSVNNADYTLVLERGDFGLPKDLLVKMEILNDRWTIFSTEDYRLIQNSEVRESIELKNKNSFGVLTNDNREFSFVAIEDERSIEAIGKYDIASISQITIGKSSDCDIQYEGIGLVSRVHAKLVNINGTLFIEDHSLNGVFVGTRRINGRQQLGFGDCVNIFGLHIVICNNIISVNASYGEVKINSQKMMPGEFGRYYSPVPYGRKDEEKKYFHRSPRNMPLINTQTVTIEAPPSPKPKQDRPLWMTAGPAFTMAIPMLLGCCVSIAAMQSSGGTSAFMYTGVITAVASAIIGVIWAVVNMRYAKRDREEEERNRFERYSDYLVRIADDLKSKYSQNIAALYQMYPAAEECCNYTRENPQLWSRNKTHHDFLYQRIGIGDIPFQVKISAPDEKFSLIADDLADKPRAIRESYRILQNVPVGIDLFNQHLIGIISDGKKSAVEIARSVAVQIAANNCYTDVKMVFVYDTADRELAQEWDFAKWLPHVWSEDKKSRYIATNKSEAGDVFYEITKVIRERAEDEKSVKSVKGEAVCPKPYYIIFVADQELLEGELISKYIFSSKDSYGLTTILIDDSYEKLPNACEQVVESSPSYTGLYSMTGGRQSGKPVTFDFVSAESAETFARRLLGIEVIEIENGGEIPNSLSFFDMYNVTSLEQFNILERWRKNRTYDSMKALIGKKAGNSDCYLDIHEKYHGPHGLIAGTTGSGKSETLQTYMLSLALNYSPEDVAFFVIDFKGGGMANLFKNLPHMVGQISNLSGNQIRRAMLSIKSENLRRQRIFSEFGVNHINSYTRLLKNKEATEPVPHLFIIIDEFAELKREEPEFMRELISVAQVGRSLGVHLILATQKPSGTVDDNIWSNSKFRLCLRVQDRQDSFDMLHKHDAAYLTNSGRCFLQVGNDEIFELFQSGWSGAIYDENMSNRADIAAMLTVTGKEAVAGNRIKFKQKEIQRIIMLSALAGFLLDAKKQLAVTDEDILGSLQLRQEIVERAFERIEASDIDYAKSKYNALRLDDFLKYLAEEDCTNLEAAVMKIVAEAREKGRKLPEFKDKTQLDALVEYIAELAAVNNYSAKQTLWMPVLPTDICLDELDGFVSYKEEITQSTDMWDLSFVIGLCDDPENQNQFPLTLNFAENGNHAVCGMVASGKSTFMQSALFALINKYSPQQVNVYALDFSSRMLGCFEHSPHFGGVMYENDFDKINKFFNMLELELQERKEILKGGTYQQFVQTNGDGKVPAIIIAVDNYANFREKTNNAFDDIMLRISRDGVGYGIFLLLSSAGFGASEIPGRMADNIKTVYCLEMGDKFKYADAMHITHIEVLPETDIKGRGLACVSGNVLEFQTALSLSSADDYERTKKIEAVCDDMKSRCNGVCAKKVPEIPENPVWSDFSQLDEFKKRAENSSLLPVGYCFDDASVYCAELSSLYFLLITGRGRSGKTNCLKNIIRAAAMQDCEICVMDTAAGELNTVCTQVGGKYVESPSEMFDYWTYLLPIFKERNGKKRELISKGCDDMQIFDEMNSEKRIYIFVSDFCDFIKKVYKPGEGVAAMNGFLENIMSKGILHNIFFIGCINTDDISAVSGYALYNIITSYKTGIHFGGNVLKQKIFDFSAMPFNEQNKTLKPGTGLVAKTDEGRIIKVIVPDSRR